MSEDHQKRAIEWYLYLHSENPATPASLIAAHHYEPPRPKQTMVNDSTSGPERYSTGLSSEEGLWARKGWAGRT